MHQTIPINTCHPSSSVVVAGASSEANGTDHASMVKMVLENSVTVIGTNGYCMLHVVQKLLQGLGVNLVVYEIDEGDQADMARELSQKIIGGNDDNGDGTMPFLAVFMGGKFFGGLEKVITSHIGGELIPNLKVVGPCGFDYSH